MGIMIDNQALYQFAKKFLDSPKCSYRLANEIIANMYSNLTASFRYGAYNQENELNDSYLTDLYAEWVPYQQINSLYCSLVPINQLDKSKHAKNNFSTILNTGKILNFFNFWIGMNKDFKDDFSQDGSNDGNEESKVCNDNKIDETERYHDENEQPYIDWYANFDSKNQLICLNPINKLYLGAHITARGANIDWDNVRRSVQELMIDPQIDKNTPPVQPEKQILYNVNSKQPQKDIHQF